MSDTDCSLDDRRQGLPLAQSLSEEFLAERFERLTVARAESIPTCRSDEALTRVPSLTRKGSWSHHGSQTRTPPNQPRALSIADDPSGHLTPNTSLIPKRHSFDEAMGGMVRQPDPLEVNAGTLESLSDSDLDTKQKTPSCIQSANFVVEPARHLFRMSDAKKMCQVCKKRLTFKASRSCTVCRYSVHERCFKASKHTCRRTCTLYKTHPTVADINARKAQPMGHHWVDGTFKNTRCFVCQRACGLAISKLRDPAERRCAWCKEVVHAGCLKVQSSQLQYCDMGKHSALVLGPNDIHIDQRLPDPEYGLSSQSRESLIRPESPSTQHPNSCARAANIPTIVMELDERAERIQNDIEKEEDGSIYTMDLPTLRTLRPEHITVTSPPGKTPLVVFVNPKSGGNQGRRVLRKMQWLLNPWQVFDLSQGGPDFGLRMFHGVRNVRILVAGGDGTVGWVLSALDKMPPATQPAVGVLPLGTGNDLARVLRWGGGYTNNQSLSQILSQLQEADQLMLDRWSLHSVPTPLTPAPGAGKDESLAIATDTLPLDVINNYFSFGADANTVLSFHLARENKPGRFNSRWGNKLFYGVEGGKQMLFKNDCKDFYKHVTLTCDNTDFTKVLSENKLQGIVFLNISSYAGGTNPWGWKQGERPQAFDDGLIEVLGVSSVYQLAKQQVGIGQCVRICQCREAVVTTRRAFSMQIDGEPTLLVPSTITIRLLNKVPVLARSGKDKLPASPGSVAKEKGTTAV
eukprot:comp20688_c0_seq1/m.26928 comp20688_c0_seq1/g.26928  ORF comp20688_c0_seq1/g.26928 comp20688_c0_seq1/m.26928 type:complete len:746 (-) comp20688_c0_seq1:686-2923(-)